MKNKVIRQVNGLLENKNIIWMAGSHCLFFKKQAIEVIIPSASFNLNVKGVVLELE